MNYKTYAEAKIAHPDSDIVTTGKSFCFDKTLVGTFQARLNQSTEHAGWHCISDEAWVICNPADYCSTLKEFIDNDLILVKGDVILDGDEGVFKIWTNATSFNESDDEDINQYILSAAALNGGCKISDNSEQWTIYNNTLPLCELTDEQVGKLVKHSGCVEHMNKNSGEWGATITPMWNRVGVYRIKPKSERELFIDRTAKVMRDAGTKCPDNHEYFGIMFDAGARYKDLTQHFGENI